MHGGTFKGQPGARGGGGGWGLSVCKALVGGWVGLMPWDVGKGMVVTWGSRGRGAVDNYIGQAFRQVHEWTGQLDGKQV